MADQGRRPLRALGRALVGVGFAAALFAGAAEVAVRVARPTPRVQIVRGDRPEFVYDRFEDVPLWWDPAYGEAQIRGLADCPEGVPTVALAGDSIFAVSDTGTGRVGDLLRGLLGETLGGACVPDGSWPGYFPYQQFASLRRIAAARPVDVALVLVWKEDRRYREIGGDLVDAELVAHHPDGTPAAPVDVLPRGLHRWLFERSRAWAYATLALAGRGPALRPPGQAYLDVLDWAEREGVRVVLLEGAHLDRPLAETARTRYGASAWMLALQEEAGRRGVPYLTVAGLLADRDVEQVRFDTCCHLRTEGHRALAERLVPVLLRELEAARAR